MQRHRRKEERIALDSSDLLLATTIRETKLASEIRGTLSPVRSCQAGGAAPTHVQAHSFSDVIVQSAKPPVAICSPACRAGHEEEHHLLSSQSRTLLERVCSGAAELSYGLAIHLHKEAIPCVLRFPHALI